MKRLSKTSTCTRPKDCALNKVKTAMQHNGPSSYATNENKVLGVYGEVNGQFCLGAGKQND